MRHQQWVQQKAHARTRVVRRIEVANREKAARTEEHESSVKKYEEHVAKLQAKKALHDAQLLHARETFNAQQSAMMSALARSDVGDRVISETELETAIAAKKPHKHLPRL